MPTVDTLEILKNGLPATDLPSRHVVIVGAGMAGLTAERNSDPHSARIAKSHILDPPQNPILAIPFVM